MTADTKKQSFTDQFIEAVESRTTEESSTRKAAWNEFRLLGFPESRSEEYKFTPVTRILSKHFKASELIKIAPKDNETIEDLLIKDFDSYSIVFSNGHFMPKASKLPTDASITIEPLNGPLDRNSDQIGNRLNKLAVNKDPFALLNNTFWQDGLYIHVAKNAVIDKPLVIHHHHNASQQKIASHTRLIIEVENNASLRIIEKTHSTGEHSVFNTINEDIIVSEQASLSYCKIQNDPGQLFQVSNTIIHQSNNSRTDTYTFSLNGNLIRNNLNIIIDGEGCESHFYGLYLTNGESLVDNHTVVDHRKPNSHSNELYKGLMDDKSKGVFNGKIYVRPHAQKTNAFQSNRNILLSESATINTKPQLEIWADDVKCSHGCTTGQLDEEAIFYLQSRGIPKATAKAMLLYAFAGEVLEAIKDEQLKNYLDDIVSERLHKNF